MVAKINALIFDFDGTLFQTEKVVIPAFLNTFEQLHMDGYLIEELPTTEEMLNVIGMTLDKIWETLLPNLPNEAHHKADIYMLENELKGIENGLGSLYPNVKETLEGLKAHHYQLFIASNGLEEYVTHIAKAFHIDDLFTKIYTAGGRGTSSKVDLVAQLLEEYSIEMAVMVGDRSSDIEAGTRNHLPTIGCDFGFAKESELIGATKKIKRFDQLTDAIHQIQKGE